MTKLALVGSLGQRTSLADVFGPLKRAWASKANRRASRPLQDIDGWSDQTEVAFYEDDRLSRAW